MTIQRAPPPMLNGHYVPFEVSAVKHQYACFFASAVAGVPRVGPGADDPAAPCP